MTELTAITAIARRERTRRRWLLAMAAATAMVLIAAVGFGAVAIAPARIVAIIASWLRGSIETGAEHQIVLAIRLPRVLLAAIVGASLSAAGAAFQGLFRNPLADPYIIGISGGAAFGAAVALFTGLSLFGVATVPVLAFAGGVAAVFLTQGLARSAGRLPVMALLLAGVASSSFFSAVVSMLVYMGGERMRPLTFWLLGSLAGATWRQVAIVFCAQLPGLALMAGTARSLNAFLLGEEAAHYSGVSVRGIQRRLLIAGALMTSATVSVGGVIGFVGLITPHVVRLLIGADHRYLLPGSIMVGAMFMIICDTLARTVMAPLELPVGIFTALAGAPFFLYLLRHVNRKAGLQ